MSQLATKHKLKLWEALALSVALMGPTIAMALNGVGVAGLAGPSVPLVFALGFLGVALVAYGFVRLTRYFNHAGSVYALAGATIGPRAGFFGGFALVATYTMFAASTLAATGVFVDAFLSQLNVDTTVSWLIVAAMTAVIVAVLCTRDSRVTARTLFVIEVVGIAAMLVLAFVIVARVGSGNAPGTQEFDLSTFTLGENSMTTVMAATVFAFLSWAGFEACASLGEETDNPRRNIPSALVGALVITGVLYVFVMFAQTIGFGTDPAGIRAFSETDSSLVALGKQYLGVGFGLIIAFTALVSSIASALGSTTAGSRLIFALARDGFGPKALAKTSPSTGAPTPAVSFIVVVTFTICVVLFVRDESASDVYFWTATLGVLCLLIVYVVAAAGVIVFTLRGRASIPKWEIVIPAMAICYLGFVIYKQSVGQPAPYNIFPYVAAGWCLLGLAIAWLAPGLAQRIGARLSKELTHTGSDLSAVSASAPATATQEKEETR
ncbi:APC family permease [Nocardioidaceae bacterium SCSIO 66511]|nr:APC family permease [Nocardioidaceae bacterium SCSIO 66511]